jgi:capsular polysaccharide transport system permease protein
MRVFGRGGDGERMAGTLVGKDLRRGFAAQARIVGALILREMRTRFGQYQFGYAWALVEPLVQIGILTTMFYLTGAHPPLGSSFETYFLTGFVAFTFFRDPAGQAMQAITANRALLSFPPVRNVDTIWARIVLEVLTNTVALIFVMLLFAFLEIPVVPDDTVRFAEGFLAMSVMGAGLGIFNAAINPLFKQWAMIFGWFMRVQYFASGVFFVPERLPPLALDILKWNPAMHGIVLVREGFYPGYRSIILVEIYPFAVGASLGLLGLLIEFLMRRRISLK